MRLQVVYLRRFDRAGNEQVDLNLFQMLTQKYRAGPKHDGNCVG